MMLMMVMIMTLNDNGLDDSFYNDGYDEVSDGYGDGDNYCYNKWHGEKVHVDEGYVDDGDE